MTRKPLIALLAALGLTVGSAGIAAARETGTPGASQGVIIAPMGGSVQASGGPGIGWTNQGKTQIAAELQTFPQLSGIKASDYTVAELTNMLHAARRGRMDVALYFANHENLMPGGPGIGATDQGKSQLAAQLGADPGNYTTGQLDQMQNDVQRGHMDAANFTATHGDPAPYGYIVFVPVVAN
ncbi:hypothetical protein [Thioclava pacifica]|uniref:Uncharacterized protein n=1 Tax=Thioclava pacifica DSM 10166 TaxID=1353537 RepID=A0A074J8F3_9RHOB|nr:hypothetical protein [Thioclava pacifica]KEO52854.1 hypothetical protein TP2_07905 [Thioclava pacifica DSM 10166]